MKALLLTMAIVFSALAAAAEPPQWAERGVYLVYYTVHSTVIRAGPAVFSEAFYCVENYTVADYNDTHVLVEYSVVDTNDTGGRVFQPPGYHNTSWMPWSMPLVNNTEYNISVDAYRAGVEAILVNKTVPGENTTVEILLNASYDPGTGILEKYILEITIRGNATTTVIRRQGMLIDTNTGAPVEEKPQSSGTGAGNTTETPGTSGEAGGTTGGATGTVEPEAPATGNLTGMAGGEAGSGGEEAYASNTYVFLAAAAVIGAALLVIAAMRRGGGEELAEEVGEPPNPPPEAEEGGVASPPK